MIWRRQYRYRIKREYVRPKEMCSAKRAKFGNGMYRHKKQFISCRTVAADSFTNHEIFLHHIEGSLQFAKQNSISSTRMCLAQNTSTTAPRKHMNDYSVIITTTRHP